MDTRRNVDPLTAALGGAKVMFCYREDGVYDTRPQLRAHMALPLSYAHQDAQAYQLGSDLMTSDRMTGAIVNRDLGDEQDA